MRLRSPAIELYVLGIISLLCIFLALSHQIIQPVNRVDPAMSRYEKASALLVQIVELQGGKTALGEFRRMVERDPELSNMCHPLAHEVGHAAYMLDGLQALDTNDDICGSGYMHGVIESHFATVTDITKELKTTCAPLAGKCFHGLGHGLMYASEGDVPGSLRLCDTLDTSAERHQCFEGVFMELFETDLRSHPTEYLSLKDPFYPCSTYKGAVRGVCAFYAPRWYLRQNPGEYAEALEWCRVLNYPVQDACMKGVGSVAMKENMTAPLRIEQICAPVADPVLRQQCIAGGVSYFVVHFASAAKGKALCGSLLPDNQQTCSRIAQESMAFYPD